MDDFYSEMQDVLEDLSPKESFQSQDSEFLSSYFPNMFSEALVPINPRRWPAFTAGSTMASDMPQFLDKLQTPIDNLVVAKEYLETSQSDLQWRARAWQILEDTVTINGFCECGQDLGSFTAGTLATQKAILGSSEMLKNESNISILINHGIREPNMLSAVDFRPEKVGEDS